MRSIFCDETGDLYTKFSGTSSVCRIGLDQIMDTKNSPWFDNVTTKEKTENLNDDIVTAFKTSIAELQKSSGNDPATWQWGSIHHLVLAHSLASVKILDRVFNLNRGPFPVGGSFHTVSPYSYDATEPFDADHGSSHRHIFDVADWDRSLTIIPTGNSGIPASRHYCDQTEMYVNGKYHADFFSKDKVVSHARYHMQFVP
jgi:penicillin amidase